MSEFTPESQAAAVAPQSVRLHPEAPDQEETRHLHRREVNPQASPGMGHVQSAVQAEMREPW
jgi:hypothetical protein